MTDVHVHVLRKMFFHLVTKKNSESPRGIEPQTFRFAPGALHYAIDIADPSSMQDACH